MFDVKGSMPAISMSGTELTDDGVFAAVKADLVEPLRTQTLEYLLKSKMPSGVR